MAKKGKCWAECVSPCRGGITGEHYLSHTLFLEEFLIVEGLHLSGRPTRLNINSLIAPCLCKEHNYQLRELDRAAGDVANALRRLEEVSFERRDRSDNARDPVSFEVSGLLFERWALKVAAGFAAVKARELGTWRPPEDLAHAAFGTRELRPGAGLHAVASIGSTFRHEERWQLGFGKRHEDPGPTALFLRFRGWPFLVTWSEMAAGWAALNIEGRNIPGADLLPRPRRFEMNGYLSLRFSWEHSFQPTDDLAGLRACYVGPSR